MTGGIALINGGRFSRPIYLIDFADGKTGNNGRALAIIAATRTIVALVMFAPAFARIRG